jgi:hypothetical protein
VIDFGLDLSAREQKRPVGRACKQAPQPAEKRHRFAIFWPLAKVARSARYTAKGVPAQLSARLCALLEIEGDQEPFPFEYPRGCLKERARVTFSASDRASCPRLQAPVFLGIPA